jgi:peptide alpha-N-acetyltransferase
MNPLSEIRFRKYQTEQDLHDSIHLIEADLSEPYSIYTYRYFLHAWPHLSYLYPSLPLTPLAPSTPTTAA